MAMINFRIDDHLKEVGDSVLKELGMNATQFLTLCYRYLEQQRKLPFVSELCVYSTADLFKTMLQQLLDLRNLLERINKLLDAPQNELQKIAEEKRELTRLASEYQRNGYRLESLPMDTMSLSQPLLSQAQYYLSVCDFALSDTSRNVSLSEGRRTEFRTAFLEFEKRVSALKLQMLDEGLFPAPTPIRQYIYNGSIVTVNILQPEEYQHGAWKVRLEIETHTQKALLEKAGFPFPLVDGRLFLPGQLYGKAIYNAQSNQFEMGFQFINCISEFHMYSNGYPEESNPISLDDLASVLCLRVEECIRNFLAKGGSF
ncbi:UNVERIFIED_ORG: antitoxin component of RelBE/YafQ-DinJ toxin-antitoxin module [Rahnella aquatilis]